LWLNLGCGYSGQQTFDLAHYTRDLLLVSQRNHEELITLVKADYSVRKKPDSVKEWISTQ
jgi:hypothetical protein